MRRLSRVLLNGGIVAIVLALSKIHARYIADVPYSWHTSPRMWWSAGYILLLAVVAYSVGLPDLVRSRKGTLLAAVTAAFGGALAISGVQLLVGNLLLPRFVVFGTVLALVPWYWICVEVSNSGRRHAADRDRVLLVGASPEEEALLHDDLAGDAELPAILSTSVAIADAANTDRDADRLESMASEFGITVIVLAGRSRDDSAVVAQVARLHERGIRVRTLSLFYEQWLGKLPISELERMSLMFDIGEVHRAQYARATRVIDVPLALVGCVVLVLLTPIVALVNLFANRGRVFFRQDRVGKDGKLFSILKFRTMTASSEAEFDGQWTQENDPRVTRFGRLLRISHLDELPQCINILRGDLAVVGPRPEQPRYVEELRAKLAFYDLRHLVHPGLTGWAQVKYGYAGDESDALEKLQYEFFYLRHQGVLFDLKIMGRTLRTILGRSGR